MVTAIQKYLSLTAKKLTDAEIKALPTTGIEIIPTYGDNKIIIPVSAHVHFKSTVAYTNLAANLIFALLRGTAGGNILLADMLDAGLGAAVNTDWNMIEQQVMDLPADIINKALNLKLTNGASGNLTGGASTNELTVTVAYFVLHV